MQVFYEMAIAYLDKALEVGQRTGNEDVLIEVATARSNAIFSDENDQFGEETLAALLPRREPVRLNTR